MDNKFISEMLLDLANAHGSEQWRAILDDYLSMAYNMGWAERDGN